MMGNQQEIQQSKKIIKIGIIGYGQRIQQVVGQLLRLDHNIQVVAISDTFEYSRQGAKKQLKKAQIFENYKKMLEVVPEIDWVFIGSWNNVHAQQIIDCIKLGKNVFCEKPLATKVEDCLQIQKEYLQFVDKNSKGKQIPKIIVGFTLRYSPFFQKIYDLIHTQKRLGTIISMEFNETLDFNHGGFIMGDWRRMTELSGGHLLEKCCHDIDIANYLIQSKVENVASFGGLNFFTPQYEYRMKQIGKEAYELWGGLISKNPFTCDKDIVDNQVCIMEYDNNVRATFHTNINAAISERRIYILGSHGTLRGDLITGKMEFQEIGYHKSVEDYTDVENCGMHGNGDIFLCKQIRENMLNIKQQPLTTLTDGIISAVTCLGIDQARTNKEVVNMKKQWEQFQL